MLWRQALSLGVCPYSSCDIRARTCKHLDAYLRYRDNPHKYGKPAAAGRKEIELHTVENVDDLSFLAQKDQEPKVQVWNLFKKLRRYPLNNDQIGVLLRRFAYGMSFKTITQEMYFVDLSTTYRRYKQALRVLRTYKFGGVNE